MLALEPEQALAHLIQPRRLERAFGGELLADLRERGAQLGLELRGERLGRAQRLVQLRERLVEPLVGVRGGVGRCFGAQSRFLRCS